MRQITCTSVDWNTGCVPLCNHCLPCVCAQHAGGPQYPAAGWGASTSAMPADKDTSKPWVPPAGGVPPAVPPPPPGYPPQQAGYAPQQQAGFAPPPGQAGYGIPQPPPPPPGGPQRQGSVGSGMYIVNVDPDTATAMAFAQTAVRNGFVRKVRVCWQQEALFPCSCS